VAGNQQPVHCYRLVANSNWSHISIHLRDILTKTSEIHISPTAVSFNLLWVIPWQLSQVGLKEQERVANLKMKSVWSHLHLRTPPPVATTWSVSVRGTKSETASELYVCVVQCGSCTTQPII